jgi:hypothetical protein
VSLLLAVSVVPHLCGRLRQVDIKAEHFERQVQRVEQERDDWMRRHEVCTLTIQYSGIASLTVYSARRKWKLNMARRKRSWMILLRTWRVSNILLLLHHDHDHYTAMSVHGAGLNLQNLWRGAFGHSLILCLVSYTVGYCLGE